MPPDRRGACGHSKSAPDLQIVAGAERGLEDPRSVRPTRGTGSVPSRETADRASRAGSTPPACRRLPGCAPFRGSKRRARRSSSRRSTSRPASGNAARISIVSPVPAISNVGGRRLAVHRQAGARLVLRRPAEDVEAEVVAHDAGQQARLHGAAVVRGCRAGSYCAGSIDVHGGVQSGFTPARLVDRPRRCGRRPDSTVTRRSLVLDGRGAAGRGYVGHSVGHGPQL